MWENCSKYFRIIFLILVSLFAIYFIYTNEMSKRQTTETFVANVVEPEYRASIIQVFNTVLGRDPYEFETILYRDEMKSPTDVRAIEIILMNSTEYKNSVAKSVIYPAVDRSVVAKEASPTPITGVVTSDAALSVLQNMDLEKRMDAYRKITAVYETNLYRLPNIKELNYYTYRMQVDKDFSLVKLEFVLQSSREYKILVLNQTNLVNAQLPGNITEAQMKLIIGDIYKKVYGSGSTPSAEMMTFMTAKYIEYKMDNKKLQQMLTMLQNIEASKISDAALTLPIPATSSAVVTQESATSASAANKSKAELDLSKKDPELAIRFGSEWNPAIPTTGGACSKTGYNKAKFYDSLYENIKTAQTSSACVPGQTGNPNQQVDHLANVMQQRNQDEMQFACDRNSYFSAVDQEMAAGKVVAIDANVLPQFRNTRHGSFLGDAAETTVGSIMPKFIYKEYA